MIPAPGLNWLELAAPDLARETGFLTAVLGWQARRVEPRAHPHAWVSRAGYSFVGVSARDPVEVPPGWSGYVQVPDLDAALAHAVALGAVAVGRAATIPGLVSHARITDPTGNPLGLYQVLGSDGPHRPLAPGEIDPIALRCLFSPDADRIAGFLRDLFGWTHDVREACHLLTADGAAPVLILPATAERAAGWRFLFAVADMQAALAALQAQGGRVDDAAVPIPGWVTGALGLAADPILVRDPYGIGFGLIQARLRG